jgi:hypothetical protein
MPFDCQEQFTHLVCGKYVVETFNFVFVSKNKFPFQKAVFTRPDRTWMLLDLKLKQKYFFSLVGILIILKGCHLQTENLKKLIFANKN